jgi:hypothetical protein
LSFLFLTSAHAADLVFARHIIPQAPGIKQAEGRLLQARRDLEHAHEVPAEPVAFLEAIAP